MKILKDIFLVVIYIIILLTIGTNIKNQVDTVREARRKNEEVAGQVNKLKEEIRMLENQIEFATSSTYINQQMRSLFGRGTKDDFWIIGEVEDVFDPYPVTNVGGEEKLWKQWLGLFTEG